MQEEKKPNQDVTPEAKSISPEAEIVAANKPQTPGGTEGKPAKAAPKTQSVKDAGPPAPKKIVEGKNKKSGGKFLTIMGFSLAGLFVVFIVLMVLVIAEGGEQSPVLQAFGIDAAGIKSFLLTVVSLSFGLLALLFFLFIVIGVFRMLFARKDDKEARRRGVRMTIVGVIPLVFIMFIWLFLYNFISSIEIEAERVKAEITVTNPTDLTDLQAPLTVTFSSENVIKNLQNSGFTVESVKWDFNGDGTYETTATDFEVSYLYNQRGSYVIGLQVSISGEAESRVYYYTLTIGEAVFDANPSTGTAPLEVDFDATSLIPKTKKVQSLDWDFDEDGIYDKTGADNLKVSYTFKQIGKYNVHLRFVDQQNLVENYYREIEVTTSETPVLSAVIEATPGLSGIAPLQIRFDGDQSVSLKGTITGYEWDFGDGSQTQKGVSVSHTYSKIGTYTVTLTVTEDTGATETTTETVEAKSVSSEPEAVIYTTTAPDEEGVINGEIPFKISFDASKSTDSDDDIVSYDWDIDGESMVGQRADYTFETAGTYTVTLTVTDSEGQTGADTATVKVTEPGVKASISATPEDGVVPLTVSFDGSSSSAYTGNIVSYEWDFGDGSEKSITGARVTHKYEEVGTYTVELKVTTNQNESDEIEKTIFVREIPLRACFTPSRNSGEPPLTVTFDSKCSTGAISKYQWDFADGSTSTSAKPAHTFNSKGVYNVTLEVYDAKNNLSTFSDTITVETQLE